MKISIILGTRPELVKYVLQWSVNVFDRVWIILFCILDSITPIIWIESFLISLTCQKQSTILMWVLETAYCIVFPMSIKSLFNSPNTLKLFLAWGVIFRTLSRKCPRRALRVSPIIWIQCPVHLIFWCNQRKTKDNKPNPKTPFFPGERVLTLYLSSSRWFRLLRG